VSSNPPGSSRRLGGHEGVPVGIGVSLKPTRGVRKVRGGGAPVCGASLRASGAPLRRRWALPEGGVLAGEGVDLAAEVLALLVPLPLPLPPPPQRLLQGRLSRVGPPRGGGRVEEREGGLSAPHPPPLYLYL